MSEDKKEKSVLYFANLCLEKRVQIKELQEEEKRYKYELRALMKDYNITYAKNENVEVKINYPKSFDIGLCSMEHPKEVKGYITEETITTVKENFDKKAFKRFYPKLFEEYNTPLTPRLIIK